MQTRSRMTKSGRPSHLTAPQKTPDLAVCKRRAQKHDN